MRLPFIPVLSIAALLFSVAACVDPLDLTLRGTVNVIVVDGTVTNLAEPQTIKLNRSKADPLTGRFGVLPVTKAIVEVVVDSVEVIACHETVDGTYQLPGDFRGRTGHAYQLRFTLPDGTRYGSDQQVMQAVPPIDRVAVAFNPTSLPPGLYPNRFRAGYDVLVRTQDPPNQRNQYRWDWRLYEKQTWCRSCYQGIYVDTVQQSYFQNGVYTFTLRAVEDCVEPNLKPNADFYNDYTCRAPCWEIIHNYTLNLFGDQLTNGGLLAGRNVAQVPLLTRQPALLELRQSSLTKGAYRYFELFQQQTQNTGGLADTPPTALVGNVRNRANARESVIGFFTASAVATSRSWLDKQDATRLPLGAYDDAGQIVLGSDELFYSLIRRQPAPGPEGPLFTAGGPGRTIRAPCIPGENRTPIKPEGWRD